MAVVPKGKGNTGSDLQCKSGVQRTKRCTFARVPARYYVKLLVNSAAIAIVVFLVSLGQRPLRGPPQIEDRPYSLQVPMAGLWRWFGGGQPWRTFSSNSFRHLKSMPLSVWRG